MTDAAGREVRGRLGRLSSDAIVVEADGAERLAAADVRRIRARARGPLTNGALAGLVVGGGLGTAWCVGAIADDSGDLDARIECAEGFTIFPALGALIGLAVDAVLPGRMRVVYQAAQPQAAGRVGVVLWPVLSPRATGLSVSFGF